MKKNHLRVILFSTTLAFSMGHVSAEDVVWYDGVHAVSYYLQKNVDPVVKVAADMFTADIDRKSVV